VLAGDFHETPGFIGSTPSLTDVFFYDAVRGLGLMFRSAAPDDPLVREFGGLLVGPTAVAQNLPRNATCVATGNFGGFGATDLAFYNGPNGVLSFYAFRLVTGSETAAELVPIEVLTGLRPTGSLLVPGIFSMLNPDDHWVNDGPPVPGPPAYDPNWRFSTGSWTNLLLYDRAAYLGEIYFRGERPCVPPRARAEHGEDRFPHRGTTTPPQVGLLIPRKDERG
jgi:hypothetical protein